MFKKIFCILFVYTIAFGMLVAEETKPLLGVAVMNRDVFITDHGEYQFADATKGQVYYSPKTVDAGYLIVSPDVNGRMCMAILPFCDEWGHVAAESWIYDALLPTNTVVAKMPIALTTGFIPLQKGFKYPVIALDKNTYTLAYRFYDLERNVTIALADATFELPPEAESDPRKIQENKFKLILENALKEQNHLRKELSKSRENSKRVADLVKQISLTGTERKRMLADIAKSEARYSKLLGYESQTKKTADAMGNELRSLSETYGKMSATLDLADAEANGLKTLYSLLIQIDDGIERIKIDVMEKKAEITGIVDHYSDDKTNAEKRRGRSLVEMARKKLSGYEIQIKQLGMQKEVLKKLFKEIDVFRKKLDEKDADVDQLKTEIEKIQANVKADGARDGRSIKYNNTKPKPKHTTNVEPIKNINVLADVKPEIVEEQPDYAQPQLGMRVIDPLDTAAGWFVEKWGDPGTLTIDVEDRLQVDVTVGDKRKLAISKYFNDGLTLGLNDTVVVDIDNKLKDSISVALVLYPAPNWSFNEAKHFVVKPGKYEIYFDIGAKTFKSKDSNWQNTCCFDDVVFTKKLSILMYAASEGQVVFDDLRVESAIE